MSVQLLDKTRKINQLLQNGKNVRVKFNDILLILSSVLDGSTLVISKKGKILGTGGINGGEQEEFGGLLSGKVGSYADSLLNERLLAILSTKENVNLETLGFAREAVQNRQALVTPIYIAGERLGTLMAYKEAAFTIDGIIVSEYAAMVIGMAMRQSVNEEYQEEARKLQIVRGAIQTLSFSELEAVTHIFSELNGTEGVLVASKIADRVGITRSVIVNALRKFESAGVIESRSSGMRGTYIKILNDAVFEEIAAYQEENGRRRTAAAKR